MKSDDKFYITLAVLGIVGLIAIIILKDKKATPALGDSSSSDEYLKKKDFETYIKSLLKQKEYVRSLPSDVRVNSMYEGKEF